MIKEHRHSPDEESVSVPPMSFLETGLNKAVTSALLKTVDKSASKSVDVVKHNLGMGSFDHTNFRLFLASGIVSILDGAEGVGPVGGAWVHSIDATESDPSAADTAGDLSPCDLAMGSHLNLMVLVGEKTGGQSRFVGELNKALTRVFGKQGIDAAPDYVRVDFITEDEITTHGRGAQALGSSPYPATPLTWRRKVA